MKELITAISLLYSIPVCRIVPLKDEKVFLILTKTDRFVLKLLPFPAMGIFQRNVSVFQYWQRKILAPWFWLQ